MVHGVFNKFFGTSSSSPKTLSPESARMMEPLKILMQPPDLERQRTAFNAVKAALILPHHKGSISDKINLCEATLLEIKESGQIEFSKHKNLDLRFRDLCQGVVWHLVLQACRSHESLPDFFEKVFPPGEQVALDGWFSQGSCRYPLNIKEVSTKEVLLRAFESKDGRSVEMNLCDCINKAISEGNSARRDSYTWALQQITGNR